MPEIKVSKAARDLAEKFLDQMPVVFRIQRKERVAALIDLALGDLLEKAQAVYNLANHNLRLRTEFKELAAALEPWQPK